MIGKKCRFLWVIFFLLLFSPFLWAQDGKAPEKPVWASGNDRTRDLLTPGLAAFGSSVLYNESPVMDSVNPALSGFRQRLTVDFGYSIIAGQQAHLAENGALADGVFGHTFSLGLSAPSQVGVFTVSGQYLNGNSLEFPARNQGGINFSYSRDVYDDWLFGMGLNVHLGEAASGERAPLWYTGVDFGFIHTPGQVGTVSDLTWGMTLQNLGWGTLASAQTQQAVEGGKSLSGAVGESLFTLETAVSFTAVQKEGFKLSYHADLALPSFMNLRLKTGFGFHWQNSFQFNLSSTLDARELAGVYPYRQRRFASLLPAIGFTYRYQDKNAKQPNSDLDISFNELHLRTSAAPVSNRLWATGVGFTLPLGVYDLYPPEIELDWDDEDGTEADSFFDLSRPEPLSQTLSPAGSELKPITLADLFLPPSCAESPLSADAEGAKTPASADSPAPAPTEAGEPAQPDAETDAAVLQAASVDPSRLPQSGSVRRFISPNLDGIRDQLVLPLRIREKRYIAGYNFFVFNRKGECIKRIANKEQRKENQERRFFKRLFRKEAGIEVPNQISWDGTDQLGRQVPDGLYFVRFQVWDDNRNKGVTDFIPVAVDRTPPSVSLQQPSSDVDRIFSPNGDGQKDLFPIVQSGSSERSWTAEIYSDFLGTVRRFDFHRQPPADLEWDGLSDQGFLVPDGVYHYRIFTTDRAGNSNRADLKNIILSTEPTPIHLAIDRPFFSPNGDGVHDFLVFSNDIPVSKGILKWELTVADCLSRETVWSRQGTAEVPAQLVFEEALPEGEYRAALQVFYANGNSPQSESPVFSVDLTPPSGTVMADQTIFSPDGDGKVDQIIFRHDTSTENRWVADIRNDAGETVRSFEWLNHAPERFAWDGYLENGQLAPDGLYSYRLTATDQAGNSSRADQIQFEISTRPTPVQISVADTAFSPNGDGIRDTLSFQYEIPEVKGIAFLSLTILTGDRQPVRTLTKRLPLSPSYQWDGFADDGSKAVDGSYWAHLSVDYKKGNHEEADSRLFELDTTPPEIQVSADSSVFSPDGDGFKDWIEFTHRASEEERWIARITDAKKQPVRQWEWEGTPENLIWKGTDTNGNPLKDGLYSYCIEATDRAGNVGKSLLSELRIDTRPTRLFLTVDPDLISPNGDDYLEAAEIKTLFSLNEGIAEWKLDLVDADTPSRIVRTFSGSRRAPESIVWDGTDSEGRTVEGRFIPSFSVVYEKGNQIHETTPPITVDISAPEVGITLTPSLFSPDNDGVNDELTFQLQVSDLSGVEKWLLNIYDMKNRPFKQFKGAGTPASQLVWDGRSYKGDLVVSAEDYPFRFQSVDKAGNVKTVEGSIPVDILVIKEGNRLKIQLSNLNFMPNSAELERRNPEIMKRNETVLARLFYMLNKYSTYNIQIEGHANAVQWRNPAAAQKEETELLQPLSEARAKSVTEKLVSMGIDANRLSFKGMGGRFPVVDPKKDEAEWGLNNWQNRRVEFILVKKNE